MIRVFSSLEELNEFFVELGLPPLSGDHVNQRLDQAAEAEPDAEEVTAYFELADEEENLVPQSALDSYIELTSNQIARLVIERDQARAERDAEIRAHEDCHEAFEPLLAQARLRGYALAISAGLFAGQDLNTLPDRQRQSIFRAAQAGLNEVDRLFGAKTSG